MSGEAREQPGGGHDRTHRLTLTLRIVHGVLTAVLLTATHWPRLEIDGPVERTDLYIHVIAFGGWAGAFALAWRRAWWQTIVIGLAFAAFDEFTQEFFDRTFDPADLAANAAGVVLGTFAAVPVARVLFGSGAPRAPLGSDQDG